VLVLGLVVSSVPDLGLAGARAWRTTTRGRKVDGNMRKSGAHVDVGWRRDPAGERRTSTTTRRVGMPLGSINGETREASWLDDRIGKPEKGEVPGV
jgi:hypothetical protein